MATVFETKNFTVQEDTENEGSGLFEVFQKFPGVIVEGFTNLSFEEAKKAAIEFNESFDACLAAWATEAEQHLDDGNGCYIEISSFESVHGRAQIFEIPEDGYTVENLEG